MTTKNVQQRYTVYEALSHPFFKTEYLLAQIKRAARQFNKNKVKAVQTVRK